MAGQDLEKKSKHSGDLGEDGIEVALGCPVPSLDEDWQQCLVLVILRLAFLSVEILVKDRSPAGYVVVVGRV